MLFYNLTKSQIKTFVKYAIFIGLVYLILKSVPSGSIQNNELVLILGVVCVSFLIIDMILSRGLSEGFDVNNVNQQLSQIQLTQAQQQQIANLKSQFDQIIANPPNFIPSELKNVKILPPPPVVNAEYNKLYNEVISQTNRADSLVQNDGKTIITTVPDSSNPLPQVSCSTEIGKMKQQMQQEIAQLKHELASRPIAQDDTSMTKRYYDSLLSQLKELNIINSDDVNNMNNKIATGVMTIPEGIDALEKLKNSNTSRIVKSDYKYNELPEEFFKPLGEGLDKLNPWDNQYSILNTNKWRVPMPRPPICINTQPCKVCPNDSGLASVDSSLKIEDWNSASSISETKINKDWVASQ